MTETRVPAALLSAVERDLRPVRPLASPARRALALVPLAVALLVGIPAFWGALTHMATLAPWPSWSVSVIETALGLVTVAAGLREAIPGRELSNRALCALLGGAWLGFLAINATTPVPVAPSIPATTVVRWIGECIGMVSAFSIPALVLPAWLVARGLPNRPAVAGGFAGLGVGLMGDAGLRICCWDGDLAHILIAHGGAMALLTVIGALGALVVERCKRSL
jgi:hypothetical protein